MIDTRAIPEKFDRQIRIDKRIHRQALVVAAIEGTTLKELAGRLLAEYIATKQFPAADLAKLLQPTEQGAN